MHKSGILVCCRVLKSSRERYLARLKTAACIRAAVRKRAFQPCQPRRKQDMQSSSATDAVDGPLCSQKRATLLRSASDAGGPEAAKEASAEPAGDQKAAGSLAAGSGSSDQLQIGQLAPATSQPPAAPASIGACSAPAASIRPTCPTTSHSAPAPAAAAGGGAAAATGPAASGDLSATAAKVGEDHSAKLQMLLQDKLRSKLELQRQLKASLATVPSFCKPLCTR